MDVRYKKIDKPYDKTKEGQYLVLSNDSNMTILNDTAFYFWNNCEEKSIAELSQQIYDEIINKNEVSLDEIECDCNNIVEHLLLLGLIVSK